MYAIAHKTIVVPPSAEIFFVGDIHGEIDLLDKVLEEVGYRNGVDYVFSVGDLIDRGPRNLDTIGRFVYDQSGLYHAVLGNHDQWMMNAPYDDSALYNWIRNGGAWWTEQNTRDSLTPEQLQAIADDIRKTLPVFMTVLHRDKVYGIVHGGVPNLHKDHRMDQYAQVNWVELVTSVKTQLLSTELNYDRKEDIVNAYTWNRDTIANAIAFINGKAWAPEIPKVLGVDYTFHGHTILNKPMLVGENQCYIDTGGTRRKTLTVVKGDGSLSYYTSGAVNTLEDVARLNIANGNPDPRLPVRGQLV
jgi:serine/threonine protein phosphatase 1